eukprot:6194600-Pleurochrysis_carterae.AAC.7
MRDVVCAFCACSLGCEASACDGGLRPATEMISSTCVLRWRMLLYLELGYRRLIWSEVTLARIHVFSGSCSGNMCNFL